VAVGMAMINLGSHDLIFLNTTAPNYVLVNHADATVAVWAVPANTATSSHPRLTRLVNDINRWLPWVEALGLFVLIKEVGEGLWKLYKWMDTKRQKGRF